MKVSVRVVLDVDPDLWAEHNNGPWPEEDKRALNTAVRQSTKQIIETQLKRVAIFNSLGVQVEVK